jgi:hypothetical protein
MNKSKYQNFLSPVLLLAGSFTFSFLFGEMVHEYGHYVSHLWFENTGVGVYLNPFGSSHIFGVTSMPLKQMGITSASGPLTNLILGVLTSLLLWRKKQSFVLPLLLWGPTAMIQEGVNFSLGLLTPGGDAEWISTLGIPKAILVTTGILLIVFGLVIFSYIFSSIGISNNRSRLSTFLIILLGLCSLMLIRFAYSIMIEPQYIMENLVPLVFSILLAVIIVLIQPLIEKYFKQGFTTHAASINQWAIFTAIGLGSGTFLFQILYSIYL